MVEARSQRRLFEHVQYRLLGRIGWLVGGWVGTEAYPEYSSNHGMIHGCLLQRQLFLVTSDRSKNRSQTYRSYENGTAPKFVVKPLRHRQVCT